MKISFYIPIKVHSKVRITVLYTNITDNCYSFKTSNSLVYIAKSKLSSLTKAKLWWYGPNVSISIKVSPIVSLAINTFTGGA